MGGTSLQALEDRFIMPPLQEEGYAPTENARGVVPFGDDVTRERKRPSSSKKRGTLTTPKLSSESFDR